MKVPYHNELLHRVLEVTEDDFGSYELNILSNARTWTTKRLVQYLSQGDVVNLTWGATGPGKPSDIGVIRVEEPILSGLIGYRLFLVDGDRQGEFSSIATLSELRKLTAGQVSGWVEIGIFDHNNLPVLTNPMLDNLYAMLAQDRFDYLPLSLLEAEKELGRIKHKFNNITIEDEILLYYPSPLYFLVSENQPELAKRIEAGMKRLRKSGELETLFNKYFAKELKKFNLDKRKILILENPYLPESYRDFHPVLVPCTIDDANCDDKTL